jgi:hypothetical protein
MSNLEDLILSEARKGRITHITLAPASDGRWQAGYRDTGSAGYNVAIEKDPVEALIMALKNKGADQSKVKIRNRNADLL